MENTTAKAKDTALAIIAGGNGTRLFPLSHPDCPKQFCLQSPGKTFIQDSIGRFVDAGIDPTKVIIIVTNENQRKFALKQTGELGVIEPNIIQIQPTHDFAGAMTIADDFIRKTYGDIVTIHTPADQYIVRGREFTEAVDGMIASADKTPTILGVRKTDMVTLTGSGNLVFSESDSASICPVTRFHEKPDASDAEKYLRGGNSRVSTGIGAWRPSHVPAKFRNLEGVLKTDQLMDAFIDSVGLNVVLSKFPWYDCGTLDSFWEISRKTPNGNASLHAERGHVYRNRCTNSLFVTIDDVDIYASNISDAAVVVNKIGDKLAICVVARECSQQVRDLADDFQRNKFILEHHFVLSGINNRVARTNCSEEVYAGFVGVSDISVAVVKTPESRYFVSVSKDSLPA